LPFKNRDADAFKWIVVMERIITEKAEEKRKNTNFPSLFPDGPLFLTVLPEDFRKKRANAY